MAEEQSEVSILSRGQRAIAQRSGEDMEECAAEHAGDWQETRWERVTLRGVVALNLPSQRMHSKGAHGNQTRSLPVSM